MVSLVVPVTYIFVPSGLNSTVRGSVSSLPTENAVYDDPTLIPLKSYGVLRFICLISSLVSITIYTFCPSGLNVIPYSVPAVHVGIVSYLTSPR